jgi:hypothetical protein
VRVPFFQQQMATGGLPGAQPVQVRPVDNTQGLQVLADAGKAVAGVVETARAEADALRLTESMTELSRRANKRLLGEKLDNPIDAAFEGGDYRPGYLSSRGLEAVETSGDVLDGLQGDIDDIAGKLDERQRRAFLPRAQAFFTEADKRVQGHQAQEFERAKTLAAKARQDEALRAVAADPLASTAPILAAGVEADIDRVYASDKARAEAEKAEFRGKLAATQIAGFLSQGDAQRASERFEETKQYLGPAAAEVRARIDRALAGKQRDAVSVEATKAVKSWVAEATPAGGYADEAAVLRRLQETPADDGRFDDMEREVQQQLRAELERRKADTQRHREFAWQADLDGKPLPGTSVEFLRRFDPDFLRGLKNEREARWRRWKADNEGSAADKAAARRKQAEDDEFLRLRFASLPPEEQARTTPEEFARTLAAEYSDFSPTRNGYAAAGKVKADTVQRLEKGDVQAERRFVAEAEREVMALVTKKGKVDPTVSRLGDPRTLVSGRASEFYRSKRAALGRDPTPDEEQAWLGELKLQPEPGWFQSKPPPAVLQPGFLPGGYGAPLPARPPSAPSTRPAPRPAGADVGTKTDARRAAEAWLAANPNHPRAEAVRRKLEAMQ